IRDEFGLTNAQAGYPSSGIFVLYVAGVLGVVFLSPRLEPITIMRVAVVTSVVGLIITSTAQGLLSLTIGVALVGGAGAGIWMTAPVLATEYVSPARRGLVIGALTSTIGISNIAFGIGTSTWRRAADDERLWRPIWWLALGFAALVLVAMFTIAKFAPTERIVARGVDFSIIKQIPRWRQVTMAYAMFGGMSAGFATFIVESNSPIVFSAMGIAGMVAAPFAGAISDRIGRLTVLRTTLLLLVVANLCVVAGGQVATIAGALLYSSGASSIPALIAAHVRDSLDSRSFSQALAIMTILFSLMAALMPTVVGALADISFRWSYLALAALPAIAFVFLLGIDRSGADPAVAPLS
ncbi:MAG: MFS transporter, partial [Acidimicrobiales bacterium]|nr:MFS transporter [Acidimicrobiales bacterium]